MILIWSNYRSGSTTLLNEIASKYNLQQSTRSGELFGCIYHPKIQGPEAYENYVIKIMPDQLSPELTGPIDPAMLQRFRDYASQEIWCLRDDMVASIKSAFCAGIACELPENQAEREDHWHTRGLNFDFSNCEISKDPWACKVFLHNAEYLKSQIIQEDIAVDVNKKIVWLEDRMPLTEPYNTYELDTQVIKDFCYDNFGTTSYKQYLKQ
jgi:hypothetical protein